MFNRGHFNRIYFNRIGIMEVVKTYIVGSFNRVYFNRRKRITVIEDVARTGIYSFKTLEL